MSEEEVSSNTYSFIIFFFKWNQYSFVVVTKLIRFLFLKKKKIYIYIDIYILIYAHI